MLSKKTDLGSRLQKCRYTCTHFWKNVIIFVTTTPIGRNPHKRTTCSWKLVSNPGYEPK